MSPAVGDSAAETARAGGTWKRAASVGLVGLVIAASGAFAYALLFTQFMAWDDEGYFLLALRAYRAGGGLYERIETIYGPFYFQAVSALFALVRMPLDNVGARWFVLGVWMLSCLAVYRYVRTQSGSRIAGLAAYVLAFPILIAIGNEPLHPGGWIVLCLSALVLVSRGLENPARRTAALVACGALTAAIAWTKLNVGAFTLIACAACFLQRRPSARAGALRAGRFLRIGAALCLPLVPVLLMARLLDHEGFGGFALFVALSLVPFGFLPELEADENPGRSIAAYAAGGALLTLVVLALCLSNGTGLGALWHALVSESLRFVGAYVYPPWSGSSALPIALAAASVGLGALWRWTSWLGPGSRTCIKLSVGLLVLGLCSNPPTTPILALPFVWVVALPGPAERATTHTNGRATRTLLALLLVMHALHAYPVAGSQVAFFAYLLPAVGVLIVWDAFGELPPAWRAFASRTPWRWAGAAAALALLATLHSASAIPARLWRDFATGVPLGLRGAESIRLPERRVAALSWVAQNLAHNADTFVGLPGMHSLYGWSALAPPVPFYPHTWILFAGDAAQAELLAALMASQRPCIVRNRGVVDFWMPGRSPRPGPLVQAADGVFRPAGRVGGYELLFPSSAHTDLVLSALPTQVPRAWLERQGAVNAIRLAFPELPGVRVTRLVAHDMQRGVDIFDTAAASAARRATILSVEGKELLQGDPPAPIDLSQRLDVLMLCPPSAVAVTPRTAVVRAYDEQGRIVARLMMPEESAGR